MRWLLIGLVPLLLQTATPPPANLPPAYPRAGAAKILDNAHVQVWQIAWLKGQPSPLHRHIYDLVGVYYEPGDRMIISAEGARRPVSTKAWDIAFQRSGVVHIEEGTSEAPLRSVFVEMKQGGPYGTNNNGNSDGSGAAPFAGVGGVQRLDNERVTVWEYAQPPASGSHRHAHDAVAVTFGGTGPKAQWIEQGTVHTNEGTGGAGRMYVFEIK